MVAINTLRKNDLNRLGFVGKVVDMKKELSKIVKNQKIRMRGTDMETLNKKVKALNVLRKFAKKRFSRISRLQREINKVKPQLIRKGINPDHIRTINQLKRIMETIGGKNRFRDLIPT